MIMVKITAYILSLLLIAFSAVADGKADSVITPNSAIDLEKWIEERPGLDILKSNIDKISDLLVKFNSARTDKLRVYVCVVSDYGFALRSDLDPTMLPSRIKKLEDYITGYEATDYYKRFNAEPADIVKEIKEKLTKEGVEEQVIYFCRVGRLYDYNNNGYEHIYHWDNLSLVGGRFKTKSYAVRAMTKLAWRRDDNELTCVKIEKAVGNILNAIELVIDKGIENNEQLSAYGCRMNLEQATEDTKTIRKAKFTTSAEAIAKLLDNPASVQQIRSSYVVLDKSGNFPSDDLFLRYILPDKMNMMANGASAYTMYTVFAEVEFGMEPAEWEDFAKEVYKKSAKAQSGNVLLMTIPYYKTSCTFTTMLGQERTLDGMLLMPGVCCGDAALERSINSGLSIGSTWTDVLRPFETAFNHAFSKVPKKYRVYGYKFMWNGDLVYEGEKEFSSVVGLEDIAAVELFVDERFNQYKDIKHQLRQLCDGRVYSSAMDPIIKEWNDKLAVLEKSPPRYKGLTRTNLIQSKLDKTIAADYARWFANRKLWGISASLSSPNDQVFYDGRNVVKDKDILDLIDRASMATAIIGLDVVFDGIGAYYAYSNGMYEEAVIYGIGLSIPFVSSGLVRKAFVEGQQYVVRTIKGTYISIPNALAMGPVFTVEGLSSFMRRTMGDEAFEKAVKYKKESDFVTKLEEGMASDEAIIKELNSNPHLIDDFNAFHKEGKGDLRAFLNSRLKHEEVNGSIVVKLGDGTELGSGNLSPEGLVIMSIDVNKGANGTSVASGGEVFNLIFSAIKEKNPGKVKGVMGVWTDLPPANANMTKLNELILTKVNKGEMTLEEAAMETFTGKMSSKNDLNNVHVSGARNDDGTFKVATAIFTDDPKIIQQYRYDDFLQYKRNDAVKQAVVEGKADPQFMKDVFGSTPPPPDKVMDASGREHAAPFFNTKIDGPDGPDQYKNVIYFGENARDPYRVKVKGGKWQVQGKQLEDNKIYIFVMDRKGNIYMGEGIQGKIHHSSFVAGDNVVIAGTIEFIDGQKIIHMDNMSGHYLPKQPALELGLQEFLREASHRGIDILSIKYNVVAD
jgi:hypothetical protein